VQAPSAADEPARAAAGRKDDAGKPRWSLLPWAEVEDVVRVLTEGARIYADNNWQIVEDARERYFSAAHRHLVAWHQGERFDPKSKLPHLAHAACNLLFLAWFDRQEGKR
jgi:hypothetical protein